MRLLITILLFTHSVFAQKAIIKEIREIAPYSKKQYIFPLISIAGNKHAENKINKKLQEEALNLDTPGYKKSIFEEVWEVPESDGRWVYTDYSYKIYNTSRCLCLSISFVGGKHREYQTRTFFFDTFTGEQVMLEKLLNNKGKKWLVETITTGRNRKVRNELAIVKDSIRKHRHIHNAEMEDDDEGALRIFTECLGRTDDIADYVFYLHENRLFIEGSPCNDGWNALRLGGGVNYAFSKHITAIQPYLSVYGKQLLQSPFRSNK
ncbi:MAG: hypothetical protein V4539_13350 [Bacteroidota bacterium]